MSNMTFYIFKIPVSNLTLTYCCQVRYIYTHYLTFNIGHCVQCSKYLHKHSQLINIIFDSLNILLHFKTPHSEIYQVLNLMFH